MNFLMRKYWKWRLKARYLRYREMLGAYSCGASLAEHISGRLWQAREQVNAAIRKCRALDATCKLKEF